MQKLTVGKLSILITENCNLKCAHCLRGDSINLNMDENTIKNLFSKVDEIGVLVITGGEPLYSIETIKIIETIIDAINKNKVVVHQIQVITNGTIYSDYSQEVLKKLFSIARNKEQSLIAVSSDKYHLNELTRLNLFDIWCENCEKIQYFAEKEKIMFYNHRPPKILKMGRARNFKDAVDLKDAYDITTMPDDIIFNSNRTDYSAWYLDVFPDGSILSQGNCSYDLIDQYIIMNINDSKELNAELANYSDFALSHIENNMLRFVAPKYIPTRNKIRNMYSKKITNN